MTAISPSTPASPLAVRVERFVQGLRRHWLFLFGLILGIWTTLPWLAPVLMHLGWYRQAWWIYFIYSLFCHQLPQRSWFLFGPSITPSLAQIQAESGAGADFFALRQFLGTPALGWKLAWSDRMVSFYGGWFLFGLLYALVHGRIKGLRWPLALALLLPMAVDGITHMISDLWGVTAGFRQSNAWLAALTGNALPPTFYAGDAWGSFNSLARLGTGLLAAFALIFWLLPIVDRALRDDGSSTGATHPSRERSIV
ncbi:DUF2085 domain-containing protein [Candidatus Amarolinea aalborgensis]|uniref:DUF2085 domain-containing protein n=1 Tax=Candidatus Amarolinea aalborgensis TaxID=2249329 RepID=UPI003BF9A00F